MIDIKLILLLLLIIALPFSLRLVDDNTNTKKQLYISSKAKYDDNSDGLNYVEIEKDRISLANLVNTSPNKEAQTILSDLKSNIIKHEINNYSFTGFVKPVFGIVNSRFGRRNRGNHCGIDLHLRTGDTVYASKKGLVRYSQYHKGGYGNLIVITHENDVETYYAHLSKFLVSPKSFVESGQAIGLGGNTGRSTGPHLHFEVRVGGIPVNPENFIYFGGKNKLKKLENKVKIVGENTMSLNGGQDLTINLKRKVCLIGNSVSKSTGFLANLKYIGDSLSKQEVPKVLAINVNDTYIKGALVTSNFLVKNRIGSFVPVQISFQREGSKKVEIISATLKVVN